ncbi:MAG: response regulator transcription factor [Bdellovibrionales bacterium]
MADASDNLTQQPVFSDTRSHKILVVDDEPHVRQFLRLSLQAEGFEVHEAATAADALNKVQSDCPDFIILDLGLPDLDGREVIREVRSKLETPILVLSGRTEDAEKIAALERGADDYMTKPFAIHELVTRVRALLDHERLKLEQVATEEVRTGRLRICLAKPEVFRDDHPLDLEAEEYDLIKILAVHGGRVLTYAHLECALWGKEGDAKLDWELQKLVVGVRRKIENEPSFPVYLVTEPAVGYRLAILPDRDGAQVVFA